MTRRRRMGGSPARRSARSWSGSSFSTTLTGRWSANGAATTTDWASASSSGRCFIGLFLPDPLDVPPEVVDYLAGQLGIADASSVKRYAERQSTQWEHAAEIRQAYGYRDFTDDGPQQEIRAFIAARAWTRTEGQRALFDQSVAWLRGQKILLPGASILARLVSEVRNSEQDRLHQVIASAAADADRAAPAAG